MRRSRHPAPLRRVVTCRQGPSERLRRACALFGLAVEVADQPGGARLNGDAVAGVVAGVCGGEITLVAGPSGAGKSSLLRALAEAQRAPAGWERPRRSCHCGAEGRGASAARAVPEEAACIAERFAGAPIIDLFDGRRDDPVAALRRLASAGLADATLVGRSPRELSEGESFRFELALLMERADASLAHDGGAWLLVDEFCSTLDAATTRAVCAALRRFVRARPTLRCVVASAREDLVTLLQPDRSITLRDGRIEACTSSRARCDAPPIVISRGEPGDLAALGRHHYRSGRPATCCRVLRARCAQGGELAGVLAVAMPTLDAAWRDLAWPGRYSRGDKRDRARRLNAELRCISRVIVAPRFRGMGVATALVGAYLADPLTSHTEAASAMSAACGFFARAGMTEYRLPHRSRHLRLIDALAARGIEPHALADRAVCRRIAADPLIERELRRWANDSGATRRFTKASPETLIELAATAIGAPPLAYAHTRGTT